jgi:hypothetical protein
MTTEPEPMVYRDPPQCRDDRCKSRPIWEAETSDPNGNWFTDYLCGHHLSTFLSDWVSRFGSSVTLTRRKPE